MLRPLSQHIPLLSILLALFFVVGTSTMTFAYTEENAPIQCCDKEEVPQEEPAGEGDCTDCRCLTCCTVLFSAPVRQLAVHPEPSLPSWLLVEGHPSDHIQLIDYPPETV